MRILFILTAVFINIETTAQVVNSLAVEDAVMQQTPVKEIIIGHWMYRDKNTLKYLTLNKDSTFHWHISGCKGYHYLTGKFIFSIDTIYLSGNKDISKFIFKGKKIFTYSGRSNDYPDFQPLTKTRIRIFSSARKEYKKFTRKHRKAVYKEIEREVRNKR
ncbi:MAG TPA: hypothetical protein VK202_04870 [Bacteroidia bacterium]|nr:hypothetical protein [Bacteroidia bacterium]